MRLIALIAGATLPFAAAAQAPFSFGAFGDTPYFDREVPAVRRLLAEMAQQGVAFVVHVGDIKSGTSVCSDELLRDRRDLLDASPAPLVYTPGDNEWTDCHRSSAGAYDPLERLGRLRTLFFDSDESLGQRKLRLVRQSDDPRFRSYRENARWTAGDVIFVTLNVPGSNNNLGRSGSMGAEHAERMRANFAWLDQAVMLAREPAVRGLVIFTQADPGFGSGTGRNDGYAAFRAALRALAADFHKPILFVHGDGHRFLVDRPLRDPRTRAPLGNFTRVEVFGSPTVGWVRIDVQPDGERLFSITPGEILSGRVASRGQKETE